MSTLQDNRNVSEEQWRRLTTVLTDNGIDADEADTEGEAICYVLDLVMPNNEAPRLKPVLPEVIIFVKQGMVEEVHSTVDAMVTVADYDCDHYNPELEESLRDAEERVRQPDMREIL